MAIDEMRVRVKGECSVGNADQTGKEDGRWQRRNVRVFLPRVSRISGAASVTACG